MTRPGGGGAWIAWSFGAGFAAFLLGGVLMSVIAVRSDPGLVSGAPQRLAGSYILPIGPAPVLELRVSTRGSAGVVVEARVRGPDGRPASADTVSGTLGRPTHAREDRSVVFEAAQSGVWRTVVEQPGGGSWEIAVRAQIGGATVHGSLRL